MTSLCQVCSKEPPKYRCPSCGISSCSLQCSRAHSSGCTQKQHAAKSTDDDSGDQQHVQSKGRDAPHVTFEALVADEEVQQLFRTHPGLQLQLRQIYHKTLEPDHVDRLNEVRRRGSSYRGRGRESHTRDRTDGRRWTPDQGFARGLEYLRTQQQSDSASADGLNELSALLWKRCPSDAQQEMFPAGDMSLVM